MIDATSRSTKSWVLALTGLASFMVALDTLVVTTALKTIRADLGASIEALEWTLNAFTLAFAVLLMSGAGLGDRFGRRRVFVAGIAVFVAASAAAALAPSIGWLIAARAVQGAGAALIMPVGMALLSAAFPPAERGRALGIFSGLTGLALIAGPVVGGAVAEGLTWQWIFWLNVPIGLVAMPLALRRIPESLGPRAPLDVPGLLLVGGGALGVVWGLARANSVGWASAEVAAALAVGFVLIAAFVLWERRARAPMVPPRFFRSRVFAAGNAAAFFFHAALYGTLFFMAQYLATAGGYGPLGAGLRLLPWTATLFVVAPAAGALVNRLGERPLVVAGLFFQAVGIAWLALLAGRGFAYDALVVPLVLAGAGVSAAMPAAQNAVLGAVAPTELGKASGTYNMLRFIGGAFGVAVQAAVFAAAGGLGSTAAFGEGFAASLDVAAVLSLAGSLAGLGLKGRRAPSMVAVRQAG